MFVTLECISYTGGFISEGYNISCTSTTSSDNMDDRSFKDSETIEKLQPTELHAADISQVRDETWINTFDTNGHVRVDALPRVLQPDLFYFYRKE